jgi:6-phosphogluconolactonase
VDIAVGTYSELHIAELDDATGALTFRASTDRIANPSFVVESPSGRRLYVVSELDEGSVVAVERNGLQIVARQPSGGALPCHLAIDGTGRWLAVANYGSGSMALLPVEAETVIGAPVQLVQHEGRGPHPERQAGPHAHTTAFSPDNRFALVTDLGRDRIVVYSFDADDGQLQPRHEVATRAGAGPRHVVFGRGGTHLYVSNELDSTVGVYRYGPATGQLEEQQTADIGTARADEGMPAEIAVAPAGDRVVVSGRGENIIVSFTIGGGGSLRRRLTVSSGGTWPRHFAFAGARPWLLVANERGGGLCSLDPDGRVVARLDIDKPTCARPLRPS